MDGSHFDNIVRTLMGSRRSLVGGGLAVAAGWLGLADAQTKRKRKHKKRVRKRKPNDHRCLEVGQACNGDSAACCSGICESTMPTVGMTETSRCIARVTSVCDAQADSCTTGVALACDANNPDCTCLRTTNNAPFCGDVTAGSAALCRECRRDANCTEEFGPGAACVVVGGFCDAYCPGTGGTACVRACPDARM